ncbi:E3 ubiquitin-protein ligase TRIM39 [Microcaecilia unicolor]|uniref:E3 ubiquitin-protein ligase TRIM39-like n=1 Tax=Microcaecilia unicolor TaxID=1415580 RepID=A0A6P7XCM7_9AMPH|nr:E3 ubiquitin-protein ligase TRIM39-like [Microcaecilia unicolor]
MAAANPAESLQDEASCSICLDYFTDPVILDCGHNFCRSCITQTWEGKGPNFPCPQCRRNSQTRKLRPNRQLANITEIAKTLSQFSVRPKEEDQPEKPEDKLKLFHEEEDMKKYKEKVKMHLEPLRKKLKELLKFKRLEEKKAEQLKSETEIKRQKAETDFEELHQFLNEQKQILLRRLEEEEKKIAQRIGENVTLLEGQSSSLTQLISEIEEKRELLKDVKDPVSRFQKMKFPKPETVSIDLKMGFILSYPQQLKKLVTAFADWWEEYGKNAVNVTLDPETAHPDLILSECRKGFKQGKTRQTLPYNSKRFDTDPFVLGCESFTSGRHYWEVNVGDCTSWILGVCKDSVRRKGRIIPLPSEGYWALSLCEDEGKYSALTSPVTDLRLKPRKGECSEDIWDENEYYCAQAMWDQIEDGYLDDMWDEKRFWRALSCVPPEKGPRTVGILLDYEAGKVSFYNAKKRIPLFTFTDTFTEKLRPFFCTYSKERGSEIALSTSLRVSVPCTVYILEDFLA